MAVQDLHTIDISEPIDKLFSSGKTSKGVVLSLIEETPQINVGKNTPLVISGRAKGQILGEGGKKGDTSRNITARPFVTKKLIYSQRVTDEFLMWDASKQANFVQRLVNDWLTKSMPRDVDTAVIHGRDPLSGAFVQGLEPIVKTGNSQLIPKTSNIDKDFADAAAALEEHNITGVALSTGAGVELGKVVEANTKKYPEIGVFGLQGDTFAGKNAASSPEVGQYNDTQLILGDWGQLLLGFAGTAEWRVHTAGDPDNTGRDLAGYNEVLIRLELHFGYRILDDEAFAVVANSSLTTD